MPSKRFNKKSILTIPNLLSVFRILLIPLIVWLYCERQNYSATIVVVIISGLTDIVDGKIARRFHMVSDVGKVLDPIADKLTQAALVICLISRYELMWGLLLVFVTKECFMLFWGYLTLKRTDSVNSAQWYGKVSTVVLYLVMAILVFFTDLPKPAGNFLICLCGAVILMSLIVYGRFYYKILKGSK